MAAANIEALQANLQVEVESAAAGEVPCSAMLLLRDDALPRVLVTDEKGIVHSRVISYVDLLSTLEESVTVEQLAKEPVHAISLPPLPTGTILADVIERASSNSYVVTGVLPASEHLITLRESHYLGGGDDPEVETHALNLPPIVYRALYQETRHAVTELSVALLSPEHAEDPGPDTEIYRYPFSNVYTDFQGVKQGVCWYQKDAIEADLAEIPEKLVRRFVSVPNNPLSYSRDLTHASPHTGYSKLLAAIEDLGGIPHEWLVPAGMTIRDLHEQSDRKEA